MDTKLEVGCEFNNCTSVSSPGANIASPITSSLFGILGEFKLDYNIGTSNPFHIDGVAQADF